MELSPKQQEAIAAIKQWFEDNDNYASYHADHLESELASLPKPIFRVFGYAGTGKTTIIKHFMASLGIARSTYFAAFTGKAAMVMRKQGLPASTIHSLIYQPVPPSEEECKKLLKLIEEETEIEKKAELKAEYNEISKVHFHLRDKEESKLKDARLLVLDECSMVNDEMLEDLLTFQIPMIVLGDPGQLPPIDGEGALTRITPDVMLTEIHRQAEGNPIIDFATRARHGIFIPKIRLGNSSHTSQQAIGKDEVLSADQIICGKNATRQMLNQRIRGLHGFTELYPQVGEKLICLKNNIEKGLFNGLMCKVVEVGKMLDVGLELKIWKETDVEGQPPTPVIALRAHFEVYQDKDAVKNLKWWDRTDTDEFDFGYAITCHKSQGSQWDKVLIWDDKFLVWDRKERNKWLYTAITRSVESVTIAS